MSEPDKNIDMSVCDRANRLWNGAPDNIVEKAAGLLATPLCVATGVAGELKDGMSTAQEQYQRGGLRRNTPEM